MTTQQAKKAMMNTVVEAYRDGTLVAGPTPYMGHPENAQHLARRMAVESRADFVRVLDDSGKEEQWSENVGESAAKAAKSQRSAMSDQNENNQRKQQQQNPSAKSKQAGQNAEAGHQKQDIHQESADQGCRPQEVSHPELSAAKAGATGHKSVCHERNLAHRSDDVDLRRSAE